jgi:hypothetical protein
LKFSYCYDVEGYATFGVLQATRQMEHENVGEANWTKANPPVLVSFSLANKSVDYFGLWSELPKLFSNCPLPSQCMPGVLVTASFGVPDPMASRSIHALGARPSI